jgi:hypothetical protein
MTTDAPAEPEPEDEREHPAAEHDSSREPRHLATLESGTLRMGAVAAALLSVLTLVFFATDHLSFLHHQTPAMINATIFGITVSRPVTLPQYAIRARVAPISFTMTPRARGESSVVYVSAPVVASNSPSTLPATQSAGATTLSTPAATTSGASTTTTSSTSTQTGTQSTTQSSTQPVITTPIQIAKFPTGSATTTPVTPPTTKQLRTFLPPGLVGSSGLGGSPSMDLVVSCVFGQLTEASSSGAACVGSGQTGTPNAQTDSISEGEGQRLLTVFHHTQTNAENQLLGVSVNFSVALYGSVGQHAYVEWTLANANDNAPAPWLYHRVVFKLTAQSSDDHAAPEFWIPLPREAGPFHVELSVWNTAGRITFKDSHPFDYP